MHHTHALVAPAPGHHLGRPPGRLPAEVMAGRRRDQGVRVVHAHGLTLEEVGYPDDDELAAQAERARARREAIHD